MPTGPETPFKIVFNLKDTLATVIQTSEVVNRYGIDWKLQVESVDDHLVATLHAEKPTEKRFWAAQAECDLTIDAMTLSPEKKKRENHRILTRNYRLSAQNPVFTRETSSAKYEKLIKTSVVLGEFAVPHRVVRVKAVVTLEAHGLATPDSKDDAFSETYFVRDGRAKDERGRHFVGVLWKLTTEVMEGKTLFATFKCDGYKQSTLWSVLMHMKFVVKSPDGSAEVFEEAVVNFSHMKESVRFIFSDFSDKFVVTNMVTVELHMKALSMSGMIRKRKLEFEKKNEELLADVVLVVDGTKFNANKTMLAMASPVFRAMFFGSFSEESPKEVVIEDTDPETFEQFLAVIYSSETDMIDVARSLLTLADRYQAPMVTRKVEKCLANDDHIHPTWEKLEIAQEFKLADLQEKALKEIKSFGELDEIRLSWGDMSSESSIALLRRAVVLGTARGNLLFGDE